MGFVVEWYHCNSTEHCYDLLAMARERPGPASNPALFASVAGITGRRAASEAAPLVFRIRT